MKLPVRSLATALVTLLLASCGGSDGAAPSANSSAMDDAPPVTNRIDVPSAVRKNLGITFAHVELRDVRSTTRVPGHFELTPAAHRAYHATLSGQIELLVEQYESVKAGDVLFRVESPEWHAMQQELADTILAIRKAHAQMESARERTVAVQGHVASLRAQSEVWRERLRQVEGIGAAGGGIATARTEARAELAAAQTALAEVVEEEVELRGLESSLRVELTGYRESTPVLHAEAIGECTTCAPDGEGPLDLALARAGALLGVGVAHLTENVGTEAEPLARWRALERIDVVATQNGVVEKLSVSTGAWIEVGETVLETADPSMIRFRASGLQADLGRLRDGMSVEILPPGGGAVAAQEALSGRLTIGLEADPLGRKIDLVVRPNGAARPHWARRGVSTEMEIVLEGTTEPQIAVPVHSVIQDGLERVLFRRDPKDPDKVIRIPADLGISDGRWVAVESGLMEGDEVVHHGVYELMLASGSAGKQQGGHFHSDGTFHAGAEH